MESGPPSAAGHIHGKISCVMFLIIPLHRHHHHHLHHHHHHHCHHHFESFFPSYSGTYWSYDACFTPARTDQLCQLVVAEGRTKCNTLSGNGKREVRILFVVSSFFFAESPVSFVSLSTIVRPTSNPNVVFFKSKDHLSIYSKLISQVLTFRCQGQTVSYLSGDPFGKTSGANVSR